MKATILDLRRRMSEVLKALDRNEKVKILYRGREKAVLTPIGGNPEERPAVACHPAFGIWQNRDDMNDVDTYVRGLRDGRFDDV